MGLETPPRRGLERLGGMGIAFADLDPGVSLGWEHGPGNAPETGAREDMRWGLCAMRADRPRDGGLSRCEMGAVRSEGRSPPRRGLEQM
jgi:hypothetical protein